MSQKFQGIMPLLYEFNSSAHIFFSDFPSYIGKMFIGGIYGLLFGMFIHFFGKHVFRAIIYSSITIWILSITNCMKIQFHNLKQLLGVENISFLLIVHEIFLSYGIEFVSFILSFLIVYIILKKYGK